MALELSGEEGRIITTTWNGWTPPPEIGATSTDINGRSLKVIEKRQVGEVLYITHEIIE